MKHRLYIAAVNQRYGRNVFLPYAAGLLWGYARRQPGVASAVELGGMLYLKEPIEDALAKLEHPDVLALSSYIWNHEWNKTFARAVKKRWPGCAIVVGGVQVAEKSPKVLEECEAFDFAIYGEGEGAFGSFLRAFIEGSALVKSCACEGTTCDVCVGRANEIFSRVGSLVWHTRDGIVVNERHAETPIGDIPSPYLAGLFDDIVKDERWSFQALQETNRGCPYSSFAGDTYVALPDRIIRFDEETYSADHALTCPDPSHRHRLGDHDERVVSQGPRECLKLTFSNGLALSLTPKHPMLVVRDEQIVDAEALELRTGDWVPVEVGQCAVRDYVKLVAPSKTRAEVLAEHGQGQGRRVPDEVVLPELLDERVAWLTGYLIGDGCLPSDDRPTVLFAVKDRSRVMLQTLISDLFKLQLSITASKFTTKMQNGALNSRKVVQFFREGLGVQSGEAKLRVPRALFRSPKTVVRAFLDGLWCADGYWPEHGESYLTTISKTFAHEIATLVHWIGDAAVVREVDVHENSLTTREHTYRVEWHGEECRTRVKGRPCVASHVPAIRHTYRSKSGELRLRKTPQERNREGSPREVLRYFEPKHDLLDPRFVFVQVVSSELAGMHETYDVHHHPEHKVAANGAFVRQCTFCAWGAASLTKLRQFSAERILCELDWMGRNKIEFLYNADANWGILKRDVALTDVLVATKEQYGYPKKFRAAFAKNSNDVVFDISKRLSDAGMLKATTLALQSMKDETLGLIKRKNIKHEKLAELSARYEAAGISTYAEIIVGLPGETFESFVDGLDALLEAGQHDSISIYLCMLLENTEMAQPEYQRAHGIESVPMKALLYHGTPEPGVVEEIQHTVVATTMMTRRELRYAVLYGWTLQALHGFGLTQFMARELHRRGMTYQMFYRRVVDWLTSGVGTAGQIFEGIAQLWDDAVEGKSWATVDPRFGDVSWPPEELLFLRLATESEAFYDELRREFSEEASLVDVQRSMFIPPTVDGLVEYAREAVWYGRKGPGRKLRLKD